MDRLKPVIEPPFLIFVQPVEYGLVERMAQRNTLSLETERLRGEAAALKSARDKKALKAKKKSAKKKTPKVAGSAVQPAAENKVVENSPTDRGGELERFVREMVENSPTDRGGEFEQIVRDLVESGEKEIAEHPMIALGLAFLLGVAAGRASKN